MRRLFACLCSLSLLLYSCDNTLEDSLLSNSGGGGNFLSISVVTDPVTKGLITSTYLPSSSKIGVIVTNPSGGDYDGHSYNNILFTANGSDANQTWNGSSIALSMNEAKCYAYYPYSSSVTDMTNIPVSTSGQDDYMYATAAAVNANNTTASLKMKHALSAVRIMIKKGTYAGTGQVTAVSVKSSALGTSGTLNAKTGEVTSVSGKGSTISVSKSLKLSTSTQNVDVIVVPTGSAADLTLSVTLDGKTYSTVVSGAAVTKSNCNKYTLTVNQGELALSGIEIGVWGYNDSGTPTITAGSYKVTFAGNYSDIAFANSVSGNTVTIKAVNSNGYFVKEVSASSGATLTQSASGNTRLITLANITSNVTVTFNGIKDWNTLTDGVYAVSKYLTPVDISDASSDCIGVALINSNLGQKLMIEKYEDTNASYKQSLTDYGISSTCYYYFYWGYYGTTMNSLLGISGYPSLRLANSSYDAGYVPDKDNNYLHSNNRLGLPSTWPTDAANYALADRAGYQHSQYLMQVTQSDSYSSYTKMGQLLITFQASRDAIGCDDWYIPACGQLSLFYVFKSDINAALSKIGGTCLYESIYWSSSEYNSNYGWSVDLRDGTVCYSSKSVGSRVRLVRDIF